MKKKNKDCRINARLRASLLSKVAKFAQKKGWTLNETVEEALARLVA